MGCPPAPTGANVECACCVGQEDGHRLSGELLLPPPPFCSFASIALRLEFLPRFEPEVRQVRREKERIEIAGSHANELSLLLLLLLPLSCCTSSSNIFLGAGVEGNEIVEARVASS